MSISTAPSSCHVPKAPEPAQLEEIGDDDLMQLSRTGNHDAFETLVRRHQRLVLGLTTRFLGDPQSGLDVAQDIFLSLWAEKDRYQPKGKFRAFLVAMTLNRCRRVGRSRRTSQAKVAELARSNSDEERGSPLVALVEHERTLKVRQALTQLPDKHREVVILRFSHCIPLEQIAVVTGAPVGTVKSHLFRGLKRLHELLRKADEP